jgi:hypothetical protein
MWHIPNNATERTLLYTAKNFPQFETLLQFFNNLDNGENDAWWEKLAEDMEVSDNDEAESYDDEYNEYYDEPKREPDEPKEIITMEPNTAFNPTANESFEIERDMRVSVRPSMDGKVSVQEYVEDMVARYPLLGAVVLNEDNRKAVEATALQAIKLLLDHKKVYNWAYLAVLLTMIQYAKGWDRQSNAGFWAYISEQFG